MKKGTRNIGSLMINQHVCREYTLMDLNYSQASAFCDIEFQNESLSSSASVEHYFVLLLSSENRQCPEISFNFRTQDP